MASEKALLIDSIQKNIGKANWKNAIADMEKLFAIDPDPIIRVRMGDVYQKMKQLPEAVKEYVQAADLYAFKGAIVKAIAQFKLALRLDPGNQQAQQKIAALHSNKAIAEKKTQPVEETASKSVMPLFASLSAEEFDDFIGMMTVHSLPAGHAIVKQGDTGKSVYVIANGTVKVYANIPSGERLTLAVLNPGDFFGEMSFLADKPRTATVETTEDSDILEVTEEQLRQLLAKRPHVLDVLKQFSDARERGTRLKMEAAQKAAAQTAPAAAPKPRPVPPVQNIPPANPAEKPRLVDAIQKCISKCDWKSAIADMEKLFTIDKDPIIRVRMGDAHQKLNQKPQAVREYMYAADLYAEKGAVVKALAQYKLALRLDPANKEAQECIAALHSNKTVKENRPEQGEKEAQRPASSVIPLFAGFSQEEFNAFTRVMNVHPLPAGVPIIEQHDTGKSVYLIANGSVKVYTAMLSGERVDLAVLRSGDFFGEMSFLTGKPRTATVETAEDAELLEITEDKLREIISQHPRMLDVLQHYYDVRSKGTADKMKDSSKG